MCPNHRRRTTVSSLHCYSSFFLFLYLFVHKVIEKVFELYTDCKQRNTYSFNLLYILDGPTRPGWNRPST